MRIVLVGASGTIGQAVAKELGERHEIVAAGSKSGDVRIDITDAASIRAGLRQIGKFDALVSAAGKVKFAPLEQMSEADYMIGLRTS
jgi:dTDP-4-dehydrorhamnose reductase